MHELYVLNVWTFLKVILCELLQNLLCTEFAHKPPLKAISLLHICLTQAFCQWFSITPWRSSSISFQMVSAREEGTRHCTAVQQLWTSPCQDQQTSSTVNERRICLHSSYEQWTRKEYGISSNPPWFASTPKESLDKAASQKPFCGASWQSILVPSQMCAEQPVDFSVNW